MKHIRRITLLLCALLVLALVGCTGGPAETTLPPTTVPTEPPAASVYDGARQALDNARNITLDVTMTVYTSVNGDQFSERSVEALTYQGLGTEAFAVDSDGTVYYSIHAENATEENQENYNIPYRETYIDGTVYARAQESYKFSSELEAEIAARRYVPVVLLDSALYGDIVSEEVAEGTRIRFGQPTAAEAWAMPEEAELTDAHGTVHLNADGSITQMDYVLSYTYGPAEIRLEVQSRPRTEALTVAAPENADSYQPIAEIDALLMTYRGINMLSQADSLTLNAMESLFTQAAGYQQNQSLTLNLYGRNNGTQAKVETDIFSMDYSTMESDEYREEETYMGGRYTVVVDGGLPTTQSGISWVGMREYCYDLMMAHVLYPDYWQDVTVTDMGTVYLLEYTLNESYGNKLQNDICEVLWGDPAFLLNLASKYETKEVKGYLSVDKYTGITVAGGYEYEGVHVIEGTEYPLTMQVDHSMTAPSKGAFQAITDKSPVVEEPEEPATPLFYHVTGENGQEMWLLGTIHVGDERTVALPREIEDAFKASDALALECNTKAFDEQVEADEDLQEEVSKAYYYSGGISLKGLMEEEDYENAMKVAKATGNYNMNVVYAKPYLLSSGIEQFYLNQGQMLHGELGVEKRLMGWAEVYDKPIREIESSLFQIKMLTGYSKDLQLLMLDETLHTHGRDYWESTQELYELWCDGDEAALREELSTAVDTSELTAEELAEYEAQKHLIDEYNKAMSYDRNEGMLEVAREYLESGDTVFYAVGLAHLLNDVNGLVDTLREAGYTVELVTYK